MKKLKLDLDDLDVERFETTGSGNQRGTAYGYVSDFSCITRCNDSEWETICTHTGLADSVCEVTDRRCETTETPSAWCTSGWDCIEN